MKILCPSILFVSILGAITFFLPTAGLAQSTRQCNPIGRILSGSGTNQSQGESIRDGLIICAGDRLVQASDAQLLCFQTQSKVMLQGTAQVDRQTCKGKGATVVIQPCVQGRTEQCFRAKGANEAFQIIEPSQTAIATERPQISWQPYPSATTYTIRVVGPGISWERFVSGTQLEYPRSEAKLQSGNAYRIVVLAHQNGKLLTTATTVVNVLPNSAATPASNRSQL